MIQEVQNPKEQDIDRILEESKIVAVIGMSKNPEKEAYQIPAYLKEQGYRVIPVNPTAEEILGEKSYRRLKDVPGKIDIVDVFRPSEDIPNYIDDVIEKKPKVFWLQLGIHHPEAERRVAEHGIIVVHNKCMKIEHQRLKSKLK
jgi:predicted CoA-binding protein